MSRTELVDAYQSGKLSRRAFVRGMSALGVSIAAANHLADEVYASSPHQHHVDDVYDHDHKHHDHKHHTPPAKTTEDVTVTALPATGAGDAAPTSGAMGTARILGLMGTSAAAAAALLRRWNRTKPETE